MSDSRAPGQAAPRIGVVIVSLNGREHLARCLPAVLDQSMPPVEVVVVDNGSTDGTSQYLAAAFPTVGVVRSERNLGFAAGANLGIRATSGEWVATLNNDTVPDRDWLAAMLAAADAAERRGERVGMVAATLLRWDAPGVIDSAGICVDRAGIAWDRRAGRPVGVADDPDDRNEPLLGPCAGAALYRRTFLDDVGAFEESFFLYLEDVDLAWRARLAGWTCAAAPDARVLHRHSATAGEDSPLKRFHLGRNKLWLLARNYPTPLVFLYLPAIVVFDAAAALGYLMAPPNPRTPLRSRLAALRGRLAGLAGLGRAFAQRRAIQRRRRVGGRAALALLAPLQSPWRVYSRFIRRDAPAPSTSGPD